MTALIVLAVLAVVGLLAAGLYGAARLAEKSRRPSTVEQPENMPAAIPAGGWLSEEEHAAQTWAAQATARDLERLDAICDRLVLHPLRVVCEDAIRQLLPPTDRDWTRIHSGEYSLVGVG